MKVLEHTINFPEELYHNLTLKSLNYKISTEKVSFQTPEWLKER